MKIVFMGTPDFAVASLDKIHNSQHEVVGVITATDKPAGRGQKLRPSAVKVYAESNELNLLQPPNLKDEDFIFELKSLEADLFVVVAFRMLPKVVWDMPQYGTINLHGSLLPQYRGAAPINWAIINGEKETGATTFFIEEKIDTGNIIDNMKITIGPNMTAGELHDQMMIEGADLLLDTINSVELGKAIGKPQTVAEGDEPKKACKIFKDTCNINWNKTSQEIHNLIRGLSPYPAAYTVWNINDKESNYKIFKSEIVDYDLSAGAIHTNYKDLLYIGTNDGAISVLQLQQSGKKIMDIKSYLNGNRNNNISR